VFYDAIKNSHGFENDPIKALIAPRPIGWISSLSLDGHANLAPYSYFNIFSENPTYVAFGSSGFKHSLSNIEATKEFVVNLVSLKLGEAMNKTSQSVAPHISEFEVAGLTQTPSQFVKVPRVGESPASFECRLHAIVPLPDDHGKIKNWMVIGRVIGVHIDDAFIVNGRVDTAAMQLIARLGYSEYVTAEPLWRMRRPS
jgi:flavin reductase (DIM6/NTAB) family NADH-FMN oxidoreductase RutF